MNEINAYLNNRQRHNRKRSAASLLVVTLYFLCTPVWSIGLEQLSDTEMDTVSGQFGSVLMNPVEMPDILEPGSILDTSIKFSGFTLITSPILVTHSTSELRLTPSTGYLQFDGVDLSTEINSTWNTGYNAPIKFDIAQFDSTVYSKINASDAIITINASAGNVDFSGKDLGSLQISNLQLSKIQTELFTDNGVMSLSAHAAVEIDQIKLTHDTETTIDSQHSLTANGLLLAEKFQVGGADDVLPSYLATVSPGNEIDSSAWTSFGTMKLGTAVKTPVDQYSYSTIEIKSDSSPYIRHKYTIRTGNVTDMSTIYELDPDGYIGDGTFQYPYLSNPRLGRSYIEAKLAFEGSMRVRGIEGYVPLDTATSSWGNAGIGIVAADGVRSLTVVQAPGYGYGNDWYLPYDESKYQ